MNYCDGDTVYQSSPFFLMRTPILVVGSLIGQLIYLLKFGTSFILETGLHVTGSLGFFLSLRKVNEGSCACDFYSLNYDEVCVFVFILSAFFADIES